MSVLHPFPAPPVRQRLLLGITLSDRCCGCALLEFKRRLHGYLAGSGLWVGAAGTQIVLRGTGDGFAPRDRALLVTWLVMQPEVVLLRIERARRIATLGGRHGQV